MNLEYQFDMIDFIEFQKDFILKSWKYFLTRTILQSLGIAALLTFLVLDVQKNKLQGLNLFLFSVLTVLWIYLSAKILKKNTLKRAQKVVKSLDESLIKGKHKLEITEHSIKLVKSNSSEKISWSEIIKLNETPNHYFLYNSPVTAIVIPKYKLKTYIPELEKIINSTMKKRKGSKN